MNLLEREAWDCMLDRWDSIAINNTRNWTDDEKKFAANVYNSNLNYIEENWKNIKKEIIQDMFMIAVTTNNINEQSVFTFLNEVFDLDKNYVNKNGDNCLMYACAWNRDIDMINFLINDVGFDKNHLNKVAQIAYYIHANMGGTI